MGSSRVAGQSEDFDISKSQNILNFKQSFSLYEGLKDTYDWYKINKNNARNNFERNLEEQNEIKRFEPSCNLVTLKMVE